MNRFGQVNRKNEKDDIMEGDPIRLTEFVRNLKTPNNNCVITEFIKHEGDQVEENIHVDNNSKAAKVIHKENFGKQRNTLTLFIKLIQK